MAWYYGTFSCGHDGRVNITGKVKDRQWKADRKFSDLCENCRMQRFEETKEKENKESEEKSKEMELPGLTGTEKQIAWANTIRVKFIDELSKLQELVLSEDRITLKSIISIYGVTKEEVLNKSISEYLINLICISEEVIINKMIKASYWIDTKGESIKSHLERSVDLIKNEQEKVEDKMFNEETAIAPTEVKHNGIVSIICTENEIKIKYEKNDIFISVVKKLGYKWNGIWYKKLTDRTGSIKERGAEIGNKLLNEGFIVSIQDEEIRDKAIRGDYEEECFNWVITIEDDIIALIWDGHSERLYNLTKKLPGARWVNGCMNVNISHYKEIEEFADLYGFKISQKATQRINSYKLKLDSIDTVDIAKKEVSATKDGLKEILESSREVIEDLRED